MQYAPAEHSDPVSKNVFLVGFVMGVLKLNGLFDFKYIIYKLICQYTVNLKQFIYSEKTCKKATHQLLGGFLFCLII